MNADNAVLHPEFMKFKERLHNIPLSVLGSIVEQLQTVPEERRYALHQGRSYFSAPISCEGGSGAPVRLEHDGAPQGIGPLVDVVRSSLCRRLGRSIDPTCVQITNGITHGLGLAFGCLLSPGDEVIMLSPYWLFAPGIARVCGAIPVEVPYFLNRPQDASALRSLLLKAVSSRCKAIYFNSPNNPSGCSLARWEIEAIGLFAQERGLYLIADNAYEDFDFGKDGFVDAAAARNFPEICFSLYSFSKTYGHTGLRIGYILSPQLHSRNVRVLSLHSIYCVSTFSQMAALANMNRGTAFIHQHRGIVLDLLDTLRGGLRIPFIDPEGGFYALLDLSRYPGSSTRFIEEAVARGVSLAPGGAFGRNCNDHARLCFTCVPKDRLSESLEILNSIYDDS